MFEHRYTQVPKKLNKTDSKVNKINGSPKPHQQHLEAEMYITFSNAKVGTRYNLAILIFFL